MTTFYHSTTAILAIGDIVLPGAVVGRCNYPDLYSGDPTRGDYVWLTRFSLAMARVNGPSKTATTYVVTPTNAQRATWFDYVDQTYDYIASSAVVTAIIPTPSQES